MDNSTFTGFMRRLYALTKKEFNQLKRDQSSMLIGVVLPLILVFIMGFGLSMDVKHVPTAIVLDDTSPVAQDMVSFTNGSDYIDPYYVKSMKQAEQMLLDRSVDAIIRVPTNFATALHRGNAQVQVIVYGPEAVNANTIRGYIEAGIGTWLQKKSAQLNSSGTSIDSVEVTARTWFNDANTSTWYLVPGLLVLITTLVGVFLTALVMAREWERGTLEALFVTPVRPLEILLAKIIPYFFTALLGFNICLLAARFVFEVPLHGSFPILILDSMLYIFVALGIGLTISSVTKNQFLACQISIVVSLMPCMMLTGFIFDLRSVPPIVSAVGRVLPPTYYLELVKTLYLAGNNWPLIFKNTAILLFYAVFFVGLAFKVTRKRLQ